MSPNEVYEMLNAVFTLLDGIVVQYKAVEKIKVRNIEK